MGAERLALPRSRDALDERDIVNSTVTTTLELDTAGDASVSASFRHGKNSSVTRALSTPVITLGTWPDRVGALATKAQGKEKQEPRHGPQTPPDGVAPPEGVGPSA